MHSIRIGTRIFFVLLIYLTVDALAATNSQWYQPTVGIKWQWQLSDVVNPNYDVELYDIDLFDSSEVLIRSLQSSGKKVICYFSAGSYENWRSDIAFFNESDRGNSLDGWPDEQWLDIRSEDVADIMRARLVLAKQKGCDGVEPDNVDGYVNDSGFPLTAEDQLAFNRLLAEEAHSLNLSIGLKNDLDQIEELVANFDFSVNEQCHEFNECDSLNPFIEAGKPVLNAEYLDDYVNDPDARKTLCDAATQARFSTLVLPLLLDDSYRYACQSSSYSIDVSETSVNVPISGHWRNAGESGWGINLTQQADKISYTIFTHDINMNPIWYVGSCIVSGDTCSGILYHVPGVSALTMPFDNNNRQNIIVGTIDIVFASDDSATMNYVIDGASGSKNIERYVFGIPAK